MQQVTIETVKKGEFVRLNRTAKKVKTYIVNGYCRINKAYELSNWDDINEFKYLKKGRFVLTGFDF